jgi:single-stranded-DNA-specific exonuclease
VAPPAPAELMEQLSHLPSMVVQLLYNRGVTDMDAIAEFLAEEPPPFRLAHSLKDLDRAVERIVKGIHREEAIAVYGDFDVDGVTSAALVAEALTALGGRVTPYIPRRDSEGYGLNSQAIETLKQQGVSLIITTDCGIGGEVEIDEANALGIDVIITDHHQVTRGVPRAHAIVNPRQPGCDYPFKDLAGVGVAFRLVQALLQRKQPVDGQSAEAVEQRLLDLVALGTIADLAPLLGENRTLVRHGLAALNATERPGLQEMALRAGLRFGAITPTTVSFVLGPRLNSAGRLADATASYRLLATASRDEARILAEYLEETNAERQRKTTEALAKAREEIAQRGEEADLILIAGTEYPAGIVGLVAGKLAEEFYRPVLVVELGEEESRGSARSIAEFNITHALNDCDDLLRRFGGHAQAAGFTIPNDNLEKFERRIAAFAASKLEGLDLQPRVTVDCELPWPQANWDLYYQIRRLAPFGFGNPTPTFLGRRVKALDARQVGRDLPKHLRVKLMDDNRRYWTAIAFNRGEDVNALTPTIDLVYSFELNEWNGARTLDLHVKDWRPFEVV